MTEKKHNVRQFGSQAMCWDCGEAQYQSWETAEADKLEHKPCLYPEQKRPEFQGEQTAEDVRASFDGRLRVGQSFERGDGQQEETPDGGSPPA